MSLVEQQKPQTITPKEVSNSATKSYLDNDPSLIESQALAKSVWIPDHLRGKTPQETQATCYGLVKMAEKWGMASNMVAGETYSVRGKLGFQGKLYAAIANAHGGIKGGLRAIYHGKGDTMACVVFGSTQELTESDKENLRKYLQQADASSATDLELNGVRAIRILLGSVKTDQAMWNKDPEQKLFYTGCTKWCRRFIPDLVLGAVSVEDLERIEYETKISNPDTSVKRTQRLEEKLDSILGESVVEQPIEADLAMAASPQDA